VGVVQHGVEARALVATLSARDAGIAIDFDHVPASPPSDLSELADLVLDGLVIGAHPHIKRGALDLGGHDAAPGILMPARAWVEKRSFLADFVDCARIGFCTGRSRTATLFSGCASASASALSLYARSRRSSDGLSSLNRWSPSPSSTDASTSELGREGVCQKGEVVAFQE